MDKPNFGDSLPILALSWIAAAPEELTAFVSQTGLDPGQIPALLAESGFQRAVLDFVLAEDRRVLAFAAAHDLPPEAVMASRMRLAGGADWHWT